MFVLTDEKNYAMRNPMKNGRYIKTTSPLQASEFTYKQARALINSKKTAFKWISNYRILNLQTGKFEEDIPQYSNEGIYCDDKSFEFDENIIDEIKKEANSIVGLAAWDINQLSTYNAMLNSGLSYYESAISDISHARLDKRPPAHIRTKIDGMSNALEEKRRDIKQAMRYVKIFIDATNQ